MTTTVAAVQMFDYVEQYAAIQEEILKAMRDVLASGSLILGPRLREFEQNFADYLGGGAGVGVGNGTDALAIALCALGIGAGDEVITVANTALPTVSAICMTGARPVFCEIDPDSLLISLDDVERRITPRTRAILPVHLFGNAVDMPALVAIARRHGLAVVEDCAIVRHDARRTAHRHVWRRRLFFVLSDQESGRVRRRRILFHPPRGPSRRHAADSPVRPRRCSGRPVRRREQSPR